MKTLCQQKPKPLSSALHQHNKANQGEEKKFRRDKNLYCHQEYKDQIEQKDNSGTGRIPATGDNYLDIKKKENFGIICYNYNKKGHISRNCFEPQKVM